MVRKKVSEIKEGDVIVIYGEKSVVKKIESSGKGIKQGRVKCRLEVEGVEDKKPNVIVRLAEDMIEVE